MCHKLIDALLTLNALARDDESDDAIERHAQKLAEDIKNFDHNAGDAKHLLERLAPLLDEKG